MRIGSCENGCVRRCVLVVRLDLRPSRQNPVNARNGRRWGIGRRVEAGVDTVFNPTVVSALVVPYASGIRFVESAAGFWTRFGNIDTAHVVRCGRVLARA